MRITNDTRPMPGEIGTDVTGDTPVEPTEPSTGSATGSVLTVKAAAAALGVSPSLVYALCADGAIRHERHGLGRGTIRIPTEALDEYRRGAAATNPKGEPLRLKHLTVD